MAAKRLRAVGRTIRQDNGETVMEFLARQMANFTPWRCVECFNSDCQCENCDCEFCSLTISEKDLYMPGGINW